jgi:hypothetical protein
MSRLAFAFCALLVLGPQSAQAQGFAERFVTVIQGDLPIILSAPHGGRDRLPGLADRTPPPPDQAKKFAAWGGFVGGAGDTGTLEIAERVADRLKARFGKSPYLVVNRAQRRYLDANRPAELAYDLPGANGPKEIHDAYHKALATMRQDVIRRFGRGIVLDIHGQASEKGTVFRGTNFERAVNAMLKRSGRVALDGPASVFGGLAARGCFITQSYGSAGGGEVDAIQIEFGSDFRTPQRRDRTADDLAEAIAAYAEAFLPR